MQTVFVTLSLIKVIQNQHELEHRDSSMKSVQRQWHCVHFNIANSASFVASVYSTQ